MNHIENLVLVACAGLFTNGLWPGRAKDKITAPYGVFNYFGPVNNFLIAKAPDQNKTVQIDVYADTVDAAETLADSVETAMLAQSIYNSPSSFTATHTTRQLAPPDPEVRLARVVLEFSVWYRP